VQSPRGGRFTRPAVRALGGGLFAAVLLVLYRVHDLSSLSAVRHLVRDWYELPVFLAVAFPIFYVAQRRKADRSSGSAPSFGDQTIGIVESQAKER